MVVTVGFFDGVHLGHRRVLRALLAKGSDAAVLTFWPHPRIVLGQNASQLGLLNTLEERMSHLAAVGVSDVRCIEFTKEFAAVSAADFIRECLIGEMGCKTLVLGYDNRLGSDGLDTEQIASLASSMGLEVKIVPPVEVDGVRVSSTRIRRFLEEGDVERAAAMLGYRYALEGEVIEGKRLGRTIGFPTANLQPSSDIKVVPANGVYVVDVEVGGRHFRGMTNIGVRPTLDDKRGRTIETHILDFNEDIYGKEIRLEFIARVRNERKFTSLAELAEQLEQDRQNCYGYQSR